MLGAGDVAAFTAVCVASGVALGADLTLPGALLAGVIQRAGHAGAREGAYFGWWNFATKLNLALAAGLALPLLQRLRLRAGRPRRRRAAGADRSPTACCPACSSSPPRRCCTSPGSAPRTRLAP